MYVCEYVSVCTSDIQCTLVRGSPNSKYLVAILENINTLQTEAH